MRVSFTDDAGHLETADERGDRRSGATAAAADRVVFRHARGT